LEKLMPYMRAVQVTGKQKTKISNYFFIKQIFIVSSSR
jgi:hypothetical protein